MCQTMEEVEQSEYVSQLKAEFDSCDTTATGFLDREELTVLCQKLQLDAHLPLLLDTLLGCCAYGRVNFEEFKDGFVAVLSHSLDVSTSEDDSSYLEPVVPAEVKPKFVKGTKRYGRRSRPENLDITKTGDSEDSPPSGLEVTDSSPLSVHRAKLTRSTSLESVESLKCDEETGSQNEKPAFQSNGPQQEKVEEGVGGRDISTGAGDYLGLQDVITQELQQKTHINMDARVSSRDLHKVLQGSTPVSCSTPVRSPGPQMSKRPQAFSEEHLARSATPSLLTATVGHRVLSRLDDGTGCCSPERVIAVWTEEGIGNSRAILQTLDFSLDDRLSLTDLTLALDNELLVSGNGIHQAALISYKNEIQHLQVLAEQAWRERDKVKADLDQADQRNLQLVREVDDRHTSMESLNQSRIRDLEQDFRDRLMVVRSQADQESEVLLQQVERERSTMQEELWLLRAREAELQEELRATRQENVGLEEEVLTVKLQLTEAQSSVTRLQKDLDQLFSDKFGGLDPTGSGVSHDERFSELVKEYEQQCRKVKELQDINDELSSELEVLKGQKSDRKSRGSSGDSTPLVWTEHQPCVIPDSDSDELDMKHSLSSQVRKNLQPDDETAALCSLDHVSGPTVSIQTELAVEQLKQKHEQELQQLRIQLETQVNFYERSLELMRQSVEVERKDICQAFKLEISELEEQKLQAEQEVKQLQQAFNTLQLQHGGGGWNSELERRMQRERSELEQNFAREISNLVQRLSAEKDQLEAELKVKMDQEVILLRQEAEQQRANGQDCLFHQLQCERQQLQEHVTLWEKRLDQLEQEKRRMVEQHQEVMQTSQLQITQSEASIATLKKHCYQKDEDLKAAHTRCSQLESRLMEACAQLEENITLLEEKSSVEEELQLLRSREEELLQQVHQLSTVLKNIGAVSNDCGTFIQDQSAISLQEATRSRAAELDSLKRDRNRLIQDLKEQAMAVDTLQLELNGISEGLDQSRSTEEVLQKTLKEEQTRSLKLQTNLDEEKEEVCRLSQENQSYARLADQLSTQIMEMEQEISVLQDHLTEVSFQLNQTSDLVLNLRTQLNTKTSEVEQLQTSSEKVLGEVCQLSGQLEVKDGDLGRAKQQILHLQEVLLDSQNQLKVTGENFAHEKRRMTQQLVELEGLVLALEEVMDPAGAHRTQLEEVRSENGVLQERLRVLQQEVQHLEDDVTKKRGKLEEMVRENERSREEEQQLRKENCRYREEVLDLSSRNLQLSNHNAELSTRLHRDQESMFMLQERLAMVLKQEEEGALVQKGQAAWTQEKHLMQTELSSHKEKLRCVTALEAELSSVTLKVQLLEDDKMRLLKEMEDRDDKVEKMHRSLLSLKTEADLLRSELHAVNKEKHGHAQEVTELQRKLQDTENKLSELQVHSVEVQTRIKELEIALTQSEEQVQHQSGGEREKMGVLRALLMEEQRRCQQLEETLKLQVQQNSFQIGVKQDQYETALSGLQQRREELETKLKGVQMVLQEKVQQLKEQLAKNAKSSRLLKDLYVENTHLMAALQVTEQWQKKAEKKNFLLEEKVTSLNKLLKDVVQVVLAT